MALTTPSSRIRIALFRGMGIHIGESCYIGLNVTMDRLYPEKITIEDHVSISDRCSITTHALLNEYSKDVVIRRKAQLGSGVIVLCGVEIGEETLVGAGSVVVSNIPPRVVVCGVPAEIIKQRS